MNGAEDNEPREGHFFEARAADDACLKSEGSSPLGRISSRRKLVFGRSVWILTMMQSCASAAKLRGDGPILAVGICAMSGAGPRHLGSSIGSAP